jgi:endoglucanase
MTQDGPRAAGAVFTSQLGYAPGDTMSAVLAVSAGTQITPSFRVLDDNNVTVFTGDSSSVTFYPGGWMGNDVVGDTYRLDFTAAALGPGRYRVESNGMYSTPFLVAGDAYDVTRLRPIEFFRIQMSGTSYSWAALDGSFGGHAADHLDDARQAVRKDKGGGDHALIQQDYLSLPNGRLDVSGGWSDAGDYNKYMGNTPWAAYLLMLTLEEHPEYLAAVDDDHNGAPDIRDVVPPALDWMLKMQHSDGAIFERVFNGFNAAFDGRPDLETDNRTGTGDDRPLDTDRYADVTAKSVYAWALGSRLFNDGRYLDAAGRAWDWAFANQTRVKPKVYGGGLYFGDVEIGLTLGALELHRAEIAAGLTPAAKYLDYASARVRAHLDAGDWTNPSSWDFQPSFALMRYYDLASVEDKARIVAQMKSRWDWAIQTQRRNAYRLNDEWIYGDFGQNENSTSSAGDALWLYARTGERQYYDYAVDQMAWLFGRNPFGESWLATARVTEYTRVPHWRATAKHPVEGVVVPGATDRNSNGRPDYTDTGDWFYSEPTINQQAMFLRVMTALYLASGGVVEPPGDLPPQVSIAAPSNGAIVSGVITLAALVSDVEGTTGVAYTVDAGSAVPMTLVNGTSQNGRWEAMLATATLADGSHQIIVAATDTAGQQSVSPVTVNVMNGSAQSLHVERIDTVLIKKGGTSRVQGRCDVFIYDAFGGPVSGAAVGGHWSGAANDTFAVTTAADGKATDYSNAASAPSGSAFTCAVDSVSKAGWVRGTDKQVSSTVTVP